MAVPIIITTAAVTPPAIAPTGMPDFLPFSPPSSAGTEMAVEVGDVDVDDRRDVANDASDVDVGVRATVVLGLNPSGTFDWSSFMTHSSSLQEYPNGQQALAHFPSGTFKAVVLITASGFLETSCSEISQGIGAIRRQETLLGQQRIVVLPASARHVCPAGQQKLLGKLPYWQGEKPETEQVFACRDSNTSYLDIEYADTCVAVAQSAAAQSASLRLGIVNVAVFEKGIGCCCEQTRRTSNWKGIS